MKKFFYLFIVLVSLSFMSCIDYVQTVSYKGGKYQLYYKLTLSKTLFEFGNQDPGIFFESLDLEAFSDFPETVEVNSIDTDLEVGADFSFSLDSRTTNQKEKQFLPTVAGKKCYIPFLLGSDEGLANDSDPLEYYNSEAVATAMLSFAKCRIIISKNIIPEIETAYFEGKNGQDYTVPLFDYGESWCAEIPFIVITGNKNELLNLDKLVVIRK